MLKEKQELLFEKLKQSLSEIGLESYELPGVEGIQIGDTIRSLVPVTDNGDAVMLEISLAKLNDDIDFLQFYSTLIMEIGTGYEQLEQACSVMNFYCPVGAFGVFAQNRQFYHKYSLLMDAQADMERLHADAMTALEAIYDVLSVHFQVAVKLSEGQITLEQALEQGLLNS